METYFWSPSTQGFYPQSRLSVYKDLPKDLIEISESDHAALLEGEGQGKIICLGPDGAVTLKDPPEPDASELLDLARRQRLAAYRSESDHLKTEAEYDAVSGEPDYSAWRAKVEEIKARYPLPVSP